jgi:hypothetical protein
MPPVRPSESDLARWEEGLDGRIFAESIEATPADLAGALGLGHVVRGMRVFGWASHADVLAFNRALGFGLETPATTDEIDAAIAEFTRAGVPRFMVQVCPAAEPKTIAGWLIDRGFHHHNHWIKLYRRAETMAAPSGDVRVDEIDASQAATFGRIVGGAFGYPDHLQATSAVTVGRPSWHHYLATVNGEPIGGAALYVRDDVGWLGYAGTRAERRNTGAQSALITRRVNDAVRLGCRWVVTETAEPKPDKPAPSFRNMRRLGFEIAYLRPNFVKILAGTQPAG